MQDHGPEVKECSTVRTGNAGILEPLELYATIPYSSLAGALQHYIPYYFVYISRCSYMGALCASNFSTVFAVDEASPT